MRPSSDQWARREKKLAVDQNREPDLRWDKEGNLSPLPPPVKPPPQDEQQQAPPDEQPLCAAAVAMHGAPPMMRPMSSRQSAAACPTVHEDREWREGTEHEEKPTYPKPGCDVSANLWNLDIQDRAREPGPMASFLHHMTSTQSPNNPSYVDARIHLVTDIRYLRREANLEHIAAHQRYLEKLQFEMNTLRCWSNSIQDQLKGEAAQVHLQLMRMVQELQRESDPQPWAPGSDWMGISFVPASTSTITTDSTAFESSSQSSSFTSSSITTSLFLEYEQRSKTKHSKPKQMWDHQLVPTSNNERLPTDEYNE